MNGPKKTIEWLAHRAGTKELSFHPSPYLNRALELNHDKGPAFTAAFGKREIMGFVGFIDLIGFSGRVIGLPPSEISLYLKPFLKGIIDAAFKSGALVDKTIGDEIMFSLPDTEADGGVPAILELRYLMVQLHALQRELGPRYPFRFGISYGVQFVDFIDGVGYSECTLVGESVTLAKRLHSLPGAEPDDNFGGAFGVLEREVDANKFHCCLDHIGGFGLPMKYRTVDHPVLKGISSVRCAVMSPKVHSSNWSPGMKLD